MIYGLVDGGGILIAKSKVEPDKVELEFDEDGVLTNAEEIGWYVDDVLYPNGYSVVKDIPKEAEVGKWFLMYGSLVKMPEMPPDPVQVLTEQVKHLHDEMCSVYADLVEKGVDTIDDVPQELREEVDAMLGGEE